MAWLKTDYIDNTLNYLKTTLDSITSAITTTKDILVSIGNIIGTIIEILGFIGFRVFILLITTAFILWLLNLVSPITRKTNYVVAVGLVIWLAITAKMPTQIVILKYILIIFAPFVITYCANFLINNFNKIYNIIYNKLYAILSKVNFNFLNKHKYIINLNDNIGVLLTFDLPGLDEIETIKKFIKNLKYNIFIFENEKISLVDDNDKIVFLNELKVSQLIKSAESKEIKLLWFWSENYKANELLKILNKTKKIKQNKNIIGSGDNSFILNFLQEKWNWSVIYGQNLKSFIDKENNNRKIEDIFNNKIYNLTLINDYKIEDKYFLKNKIVGSDLSVLVNEIGSKNQLNFKNKILFLDVIVENKKIFYRLLNQLLNYIINKKLSLKAIIFGNLLLEDLSNPTEIINFFNNYLKENNINIPFFKIQQFEFIQLNKECFIEYKENIKNINNINNIKITFID